MKRIIVAFVGILIISIVFLGFINIFHPTVNDRQVILPSQDEIESIELTIHEKEGERNITLQPKNFKWTETIKKEAKATNIQSVQDFPVNVETYLEIHYLLKEEQKGQIISPIYLYKEKGWLGSKYLLEQPYQGVLEISKTTYQEIYDILNPYSK